MLFTIHISFLSKSHTGQCLLMLTDCVVNVCSSIEANSLERYEKKMIELCYLQWLPEHTGDSVLCLFPWTAESWDPVNSHFGAQRWEQYHISSLRGPDRGPDHLPGSHYLISERFTQRLRGGQRFMARRSIRSMSHTHAREDANADTHQPTI